MVNWFGTELGMDRVEEAVNLFDKWDTRGSGRLNKAQFLRLMQQVIGANKFARGPIYQRLVELSFDYVDTGKKGSLDKRQFLISYNLLFSNERKQMALLLTKDFKGTPNTRHDTHGTHRATSEIWLTSCVGSQDLLWRRSRMASRSSSSRRRSTWTSSTSSRR
jgi:hypothetical protein